MVSRAGGGDDPGAQDDEGAEPQSDEPRAPDDGSAPGAGTDDGGVLSGAAVAQASAACDTAPDGELLLASMDEFIATVTGAWLLCDSPSAFATTDELGLEIVPNGRWYKLVRSADGGLVRASGWGWEGSWETIDVTDWNGPGFYQINLTIDGGNTVITVPKFAESPPLMRLNNLGTYVADYARIRR